MCLQPPKPIEPLY